MEILDKVLGQIQALRERPLEEVENELTGYACLLEEETQKQYGGVRKVDYESESIVLAEIGKKNRKINFLSAVYASWKSPKQAENFKAKMKKWYDEEHKREDNVPAYMLLGWANSLAERLEWNFDLWKNLPERPNTKRLL